MAGVLQVMLVLDKTVPTSYYNDQSLTTPTRPSNQDGSPTILTQIFYWKLKNLITNKSKTLPSFKTVTFILDRDL